MTEVNNYKIVSTLIGNSNGEVHLVKSTLSRTKRDKISLFTFYQRNFDSIIDNPNNIKIKHSYNLIYIIVNEKESSLYIGQTKKGWFGRKGGHIKNNKVDEESKIHLFKLDKNEQKWNADDLNAIEENLIHIFKEKFNLTNVIKYGKYPVKANANQSDAIEGIITLFNSLYLDSDKYKKTNNIGVQIKKQEEKTNTKDNNQVDLNNTVSNDNIIYYYGKVDVKNNNLKKDEYNVFFKKEADDVYVLLKGSFIKYQPENYLKRKSIHQIEKRNELTKDGKSTFLDEDLTFNKRIHTVMFARGYSYNNDRDFQKTTSKDEFYKLYEKHKSKNNI
ncbi:hypothetical protein [Mycoplasma sp. OR1901]|uniref:hypothetical protein n=1 Tax=Mycoplasma sp. OR1901 TaxID=2742195 RepID=UPI001582540A|nr:hypothetical protein [Mycoplasma sp. OR1901]QKT05118.1 hypothetical protein HTZ87_00050 [Mycoplasma sp. OR1901]